MIEIVIDLVSDIERGASYSDGLVSFPAYLLELLHNELFPNDQKHDYTEKKEPSNG